MKAKKRQGETKAINPEATVVVSLLDIATFAAAIRLDERARGEAQAANDLKRLFELRVLNFDENREIGEAAAQLHIDATCNKAVAKQTAARLPKILRPFFSA